jgi:hypothetical protein
MSIKPGRIVPSGIFITRAPFTWIELSDPILVIFPFCMSTSCSPSRKVVPSKIAPALIIRACALFSYLFDVRGLVEVGVLGGVLSPWASTLKLNCSKNMPDIRHMIFCLKGIVFKIFPFFLN